MNDWYTMDALAQEHRNDMLRNAEIERMLRQAFRGANAHRGLRCRALCGVGRQLTALGARLQEAYGSTAEAPALHPTHPGPA
jgi:hypothetical protein